MITYKLKINCQEPRVLVSDMEFVSGDVHAYRLEFTFYNNGEKLNLSDKILTVKGRRADGVILSGSGQIDGTQAVFVPANAFYAVPGELLLEIALTDNAGNYMTTKILSAAVLEGLGEPTEMATTNVSAYVTLLHQLTNRLDSADRLIAETKSFYESELAEVSDFMKNKPAIANGEGVGSLVGVVPESLIEDETDFANTATADNAVTFGKSNKNSGKRSILIGKGNVNACPNSIVAGQYNAGKANTLLELGNGASADDRSNAFEVYTDGSISLDNGETKLTPESMKRLLDMQNQCANALKATASGEVIRVDDVSPVEHDVNLFFYPKIEGESKVMVCGKNVLDTNSAHMFGNYSETYTKNCTYEKTNSGFKFVAINDLEPGSLRCGYQCLPIQKLKGKTITISFNRYSEADDTNTKTCAIITSADNDFVDEYEYVSGSLANGKIYKELRLSNAVNGYFTTTFTIPEDETRKNLFVAFYCGTGAVLSQDCVVEYANIQVEINDLATGYESYKGTIYTPNADNVVTVKSIAPTMTIFSDTDGVNMEVEYNKDINKVVENLVDAIISLGGNV